MKRTVTFDSPDFNRVSVVGRNTQRRQDVNNNGEMILIMRSVVVVVPVGGGGQIVGARFLARVTGHRCLHVLFMY